MVSPGGGRAEGRRLTRLVLDSVHVAILLKRVLQLPLAGVILVVAHVHCGSRGREAASGGEGAAARVRAAPGQEQHGLTALPPDLLKRCDRFSVGKAAGAVGRAKRRKGRGCVASSAACAGSLRNRRCAHRAGWTTWWRPLACLRCRSSALAGALHSSWRAYGLPDDPAKLGSGPRSLHIAARGPQRRKHSPA